MSTENDKDLRFLLLEREHKDTRDRLARMETAIYGDPTNADSKAPVNKNAVIPTLSRLNLWLDAVCLLWKAVVAAGMAGGAIFTFGRTNGIW